ncbi:MAG: hypothetical protein PHW24_03385 [Candidatus Moranbacteria bacterium]|nr:hypothetical protein [Candidatus Moranbacteria bacterium]
MSPLYHKTSICQAAHFKPFLAVMHSGSVMHNIMNFLLFLFSFESIRSDSPPRVDERSFPRVEAGENERLAMNFGQERAKKENKKSKNPQEKPLIWHDQKTDLARSV